MTDFGIAKVTAAARELIGRKGSTHADARMGTLAYMSPEQIRRAKEVTNRSDIFSLGATLYELATLRVAFNGDSDYEVMHQIVEGRYLPVDSLHKVDPNIAAAISRALQTDPERRFDSCESFLRALAAPPAAKESAAAPGLAPAPAAVAGSAPAPAAVPAKPAPAAPAPARSPARSRWTGRRIAGLAAALVAVGVGVAVFSNLGPSQAPAPRGGSPIEPKPEQPSVRLAWSGPTPFSGCIKSRSAERIAVTYLTADRGFLDTRELRSWFAGLPSQMIDVFLLERKNGTRLVSFEIWRQKWPAWWSSIAGTATGDEVCWRLGKALLERNIGRPLSQRLNSEGNAFEYDIFDVRNPAKYPSDMRLGDLDTAVSAWGVKVIERWLHDSP